MATSTGTTETDKIANTAISTTSSVIPSSQAKKRLDPFPVINKDNFKIYHSGPIQPVQKHHTQAGSIYITSPDIPLEQRIVNEPKPQVTLRYLTVRGKQYTRQSAQKAANSAKKRKVMNPVSNGAKVSA